MLTRVVLTRAGLLHAHVRDMLDVHGMDFFGPRERNRLLKVRTRAAERRENHLLRVNDPLARYLAVVRAKAKFEAARVGGGCVVVNKLFVHLQLHHFLSPKGCALFVEFLVLTKFLVTGIIGRKWGREETSADKM